MLTTHNNPHSNQDNPTLTRLRGKVAGRRLLEQPTPPSNSTRNNPDIKSMPEFNKKIASDLRYSNVIPRLNNILIQIALKHPKLSLEEIKADLLAAQVETRSIDMQYVEQYPVPNFSYFNIILIAGISQPDIEKYFKDSTALTAFITRAREQYSQKYFRLSTPQLKRVNKLISAYEFSDYEALSFVTEPSSNEVAILSDVTLIQMSILNNLVNRLMWTSIAADCLTYTAAMQIKHSFREVSGEISGIINGLPATLSIENYNHAEEIHKAGLTATHLKLIPPNKIDRHETDYYIDSTRLSYSNQWDNGRKSLNFFNHDSFVDMDAAMDELIKIGFNCHSAEPLVYEMTEENRLKAFLGEAKANWGSFDAKRSALVQFAKSNLMPTMRNEIMPFSSDTNAANSFSRVFSSMSPEVLILLALVILSAAAYTVRNARRLGVGLWGGKKSIDDQAQSLESQHTKRI